MFTLKENRLIYATRGTGKGQQRLGKRKPAPKPTPRRATPVTPRTTTQRNVGGVGVRRVGASSGRPAGPITSTRRTTGRVNPNLTAGGTPVPIVPTPLPQQEREDARLAKRPRGSGPRVFRSVQELIEVRDQLTSEQFQAAKLQLSRGAAGVDPFAFGGEGARRDEEGNLLVRPISTDPTPSQIAATRGDPFGKGIPSTPLGEGAGAGGMAVARAGQTGFGGLADAPGEGLSVAEQFKRIDDITAESMASISPAQDFETQQRARENAIRIQQQMKDDVLNKARAEAALAQTKAAEAETGAAERQAAGAFDFKFDGVDMTGLEGSQHEQKTGTSAASKAPIGIQQMFADNPELVSIYEPLVNALIGGTDQQANALLSTIMRAERQGDKAAAVAESAITAAKDFHESILSELTESKDIALDVAKEKKAQADFQRAKFAMKQNFVINQQMEKNIDNEWIRRRQVASMGFAHDGNGLGWMQRETARANEALAFLQTSTNMEVAEMARTASEQYSISVKSALNQYDMKLLQLDKSLDDEIDSIMQTLSLGDEKREERIFAAYNNYLASVTKNDIEMAKIQRDANKLLYDSATKVQDARIKSQDRTFDFEQQMVDRIKGNDILKDVRSVQSALGVVESAKVRFQELVAAKERGEQVNFGGVQQALGVAFQKLLDPGSVVRESEFDRTTKGQPLWETLKGQWEKLEAGGLGLTEKGFMEIYNTTMELAAGYDKLWDREIQSVENAITRYNSFSPAVPADPKSILPQELMPERKEFTDGFDSASNDYFESRDRFNGDGTGGATPPPTTPSIQPLPGGDIPGGALVPTSLGGEQAENPLSIDPFTVASAGLQEGVDYDVDESGEVGVFGDPQKFYRRFADKAGFYNERGAKRFKSPALANIKFPNKTEWGKMSETSKGEFIRRLTRSSARAELGATGQTSFFDIPGLQFLNP
jgi:hypothetical protein|tara:strand:+ start:18499 stop:21327 length:2829 start_codon:yes stop_codon:yes gene_type:complete